MKRREFLGMLGASTASAVFGSISRSASAQIQFLNTNAMPVGYVAHGSPLLLADKLRGAELAAWGASMPKPKGIVVVTPHYRSMLVQIGHVGPGFGMYNLPDWILKQTPKASYNSPDNTALAKRVTELLEFWWRVEPSTNRIGVDHTTWIPLFHMFPKADIPVVEIAMPFFREQDLLVLGHSLRALRNEGVLILASGTMTHNLAAADLEGKTSLPEWSRSFDAWAKQTIDARDVMGLTNWRQLAPNAEVAHPDDGGHYRVLLVAVGAALIHGSDPPTFQSAKFPVEGFELGNLSKRCVELA